MGNAFLLLDSRQTKACSSSNFNDCMLIGKQIARSLTKAAETGVPLSRQTHASDL